MFLYPFLFLEAFCHGSEAMTVGFLGREEPQLLGDILRGLKIFAAVALVFSIANEAHSFEMSVMIVLTA